MRAAVLMLAACAPAPVVLTPADDVAEMTERAVADINFAAGHTLLVVGDHGVHVRRGETVAGCGTHDGREIVIGTCSSVADLSHDVLVHEIGHALGVPHSRYRAPIMSPQLQQMPPLDAARSLVSALP